MIEQDTVRLLRECDSGAKMGIEALGDVVDKTKSDELRAALAASMDDHRELAKDIRAHLNRFHDEGKDPPAIASAMSWLKTTGKMMLEPSDHTVADLMTDGCNMGVKSLSKYLNAYQAADEKSKDLAKKLIAAEEQLIHSVRPYL